MTLLTGAGPHPPRTAVAYAPDLDSTGTALFQFAQSGPCPDVCLQQRECRAIAPVVSGDSRSTVAGFRRIVDVVEQHRRPPCTARLPRVQDSLIEQRLAGLA